MQRASAAQIRFCFSLYVNLEEKFGKSWKSGMPWVRRKLGNRVKSLAGRAGEHRGREWIPKLSKLGYPGILKHRPGAHNRKIHRAVSTNGANYADNFSSYNVRLSLFLNSIIKVIHVWNGCVGRTFALIDWLTGASFGSLLGQQYAPRSLKA